MLENMDVFAVHVTLHSGISRVVKFYLYIMGNMMENRIHNCRLGETGSQNPWYWRGYIEIISFQQENMLNVILYNFRYMK